MIPGNDVDTEREEVLDWIYNLPLKNHQIVTAIQTYMESRNIIKKTEPPRTTEYGRADR